MTSVPVFAVVLATLWSGEAVEAQNPAARIGHAEEAAQAFFDAAHAFDFDKMRDGATADFEMLFDGRRVTLDDFIGMLRSMEKARSGRAIPTYKAEGLNTEVVGEAAHMTWLSPDGGWLPIPITRLNAALEGRYHIDVKRPSRQ